MTLTITLPNGKTVEAKMEIGEQIKIEYINTEGKKCIRYVTLTNNLKLVMN